METNAPKHLVWIEGTPNPFDLPAPSAWWQKLVYGYDKMLRIFPSQRQRAYRLGRIVRREARLGLQMVGDLHTHPDTIVMIQHGLCPVSTVFPWAICSDKIIRDLRNRDTWANPDTAGNPDGTLRRLYEQEQAAEAKFEKDWSSRLDYQNAEAFRHMKTLLGEQIMLGEVARGRRGKTATTDKTRVKVATGAPSDPSSTRQHARGVPSGTAQTSTSGIVLTDRL